MIPPTPKATCDQIVAESSALRVFDAQRRLRRTLLDTQVAINWRPARDLAARLLLELDRAPECWQLAVTWLQEEFDADRVDAAPGHPQCRIYTMGYAQATRPTAPVSSVKGVVVANADIALRAVWDSPHPRVFADIPQETALGITVRDTLMQAGVNSKITASLRCNGQVYGLVCMDSTLVRSTWPALTWERFAEVTRSVLGPVLGCAMKLAHADEVAHDPVPGLACAFPELTDAENRVLSLAAKGLSYKEIARELQRAVSTIDHQLRSIRTKLDVKTNARLMSLVLRRTQNEPGEPEIMA